MRLKDIRRHAVCVPLLACRTAFCPLLDLHSKIGNNVLPDIHDCLTTAHVHVRKFVVSLFSVCSRVAQSTKDSLPTLLTAEDILAPDNRLSVTTPEQAAYK